MYNTILISKIKLEIIQFVTNVIINNSFILIKLLTHFILVYYKLTIRSHSFSYSHHSNTLT